MQLKDYIKIQNFLEIYNKVLDNTISILNILEKKDREDRKDLKKFLDIQEYNMKNLQFFIKEEYNTLYWKIKEYVVLLDISMPFKFNNNKLFINDKYLFDRTIRSVKIILKINEIFKRYYE